MCVLATIKQIFLVCLAMFLVDLLSKKANGYRQNFKNFYMPAALTLTMFFDRRWSMTLIDPYTK